MLIKKDVGCTCNILHWQVLQHEEEMYYRIFVQCVSFVAILFSRWFTLGARARHGVSTLGSSDTGSRLCPVWPHVSVGTGGRGLGPGAE